MLKLKSISPSRIKTFDMCKFKYWLTYHCHDVELKSNWGAAHGSLIHDLLENYSNGNDTNWLDRLYAGYGGYLETLDRYGEPEVMETPLRWAKDKDFRDQVPMCDSCRYRDVDEMGDNFCMISREPLDKLSGCAKMLFDGSVSMMREALDSYIDVWDNILRDPDGKITGAEYRFKLPVMGTDVPMIGVMDLVVEEDEDTVRVYDYKTGSWTQNYEECRDDIQIRMYSLAARKEFIEDASGKGHSYKNVILTFDYFTKYPITLSFTAEEDAETELYVKEKIEEIQNTQWINRIVKSNADFNQRWAWKCRSLCDTEVCKSLWKKPFRTGDIDG